MKWITQQCPRASIIVKVDDDMFVSSQRLLSSVSRGGLYQLLSLTFRTSKTSSITEIPLRNLLLCKPVTNAPVLRRGKYAVPKMHFPEERWPTFCFGGTWIASNDVIERLYNVSLTTPQVHMFTSHGQVSLFTLQTLVSLLLASSLISDIYKNKIPASITLFSFHLPSLSLPSFLLSKITSLVILLHIFLVSLVELLRNYWTSKHET